ncbi:OPT superfamily oligopeptide transporter [Meira miltonrushii]|uniref:OPT superfamily oligopeptide transporter n=1 Tax=Meira miltonrushii TaxID=1280837 RepID=A0A316VCE8_9BASI|nr:OPT superfamily oligopeptide transporter [Meira miltonrushii]PWN34798.1 OPT superfamily oligopeptide transporter [Meira miltonrushii]
MVIEKEIYEEELDKSAVLHELAKTPPDPENGSTEKTPDKKEDAYNEKGLTEAEKANFVLEDESEESESNHMIRDGHDVSQYLLPIRDDGDPCLTFRSLSLGLVLGAFQATMSQIYMFKPTQVGIGGSFLVLIIYFIGKAWARFLPSGPGLRARWGDMPSSSIKAWMLILFDFINPGPFGLKEHAIASITATSASNSLDSITPFTAQKLFYDVPLTATNVTLTTLSIGMYGYGLAGLLRPLLLYPSSMVYWPNIPLVQLFQRLHWDQLADSRPLRWFWYAFAFMTVYEFFPAYIAPILVAISIPCLAAHNAPQSRRQLITNLFGGSQSNEGLGIFSLCFDWQYIGSGVTSLPLIWQVNTWIGLFFCYFAFIGVYYGGAFGAKDLPFMSLSLWTQEGTKYPRDQLFANGLLNQTALVEHGIPRITATFAWGQIMAMAAVGALMAQTVFFWGPKIVQSIREARTKKFTCRHQQIMIERYDEVHWVWYAGLAIISVIFGLIGNLRGDTTLPAGSFFFALALGSFIAPLSGMLYAQFGSGVNTQPIMKMIAGVSLRGKPLAILYFGAFSHQAVSQCLSLLGDLRMGIYLKIKPRTMFITQVLGTLMGTFVNYIVMVSIVNSKRDILLTNNGSGQWSGQFFQSFNLQATVWSLASDLYTVGKPYAIVPFGILIGIGCVAIQRIIFQFWPRIGRVDVSFINLPMIFMYMGWFSLQTQTCVILSIVLVGLFVQGYLRTYKPEIFKKYAYLVPAGLDGGSLLVIFVLSFAAYGAAGTAKPFPNYALNPASGFVDRCPDPSA